MVCEGLLGNDLEGNSHGLTELMTQHLSAYKRISSNRLSDVMANIRPGNIPNICANAVPLHQPGRQL